MSLVIIGSTGLVGKEILKNLNAEPELASKVFSLTRRNVPGFKAGSHVEEIVEKDTTKWSEKLVELNSIHTLVSSLGTTKAAAGGVAKQYLIDHDLNLEIAKTAKEKLSCDTYVLISSTGASSQSRFPYLKMKGELEDDVKKLNFNKTIILQPGALLGERETFKGWGNTVMSSTASFLRKTTGVRLLNCVTGEEVGKVVAHILQSAKEYPDGSVKVVSASEITKIAQSLP